MLPKNKLSEKGHFYLGLTCFSLVDFFKGHCYCDLFVVISNCIFARRCIMSDESTQRLYANIRSELDRHYGEIYMRLVLMLSQIGVSESKIHSRIIRIMKIVSGNRKEEKAQLAVAEVLGDSEISGHALLKRSWSMLDLVRPYLCGQTWLDFGCGSGDVLIGTTQDVSKADVFLYDVVDYRSDLCRRHGFPFTTHWEDVVKRGPYDCSLALTVFHHAKEPDAELVRLIEVSRRLIIVESVIGRLNAYPVAGFVDWFGNRCLQQNAEISVPGNFYEDEHWLDRFRHLGLNLIHHQNLGIDHLVGPEHHVLYVVEKP